jgi:hypothetical protein
MDLKGKIEAVLPHDKHIIKVVSYDKIFIVDYKSIDLSSERLIQIGNTSFDIKGVEISNCNKVPIVFDGFKDNALVKEVGIYSRQCECVLFPENGDNHWILFIEIKNSTGANAFRKDRDYPSCMVNQIIDTVAFFRDKKFLEMDKTVYAILSFPCVLDDFNATLFSFLDEKFSIENIRKNHKIIIRGCNSAEVISSKRIKLKSI